MHASSDGGDQRRIYVPPPPSGQPAPPPRSRTPAPSVPRREPPPARPSRRPGGPGGPGGPGRRGGRPPRDSEKPWYKRVSWRKVLLISGVVLLVLLLLAFLWLNMMWNRIERVEVSPVLTSSTGTNYLIVGSDNEGDMSEDDLGYDPARPGGQRADTMMILHFGSNGTKILSIPRDLWVTHAGSGEEGRINGTYNTDIGGGPSRLIETVTNELGIPIDRYMEVDFGSFGGLVDGMGGITIDFEHPASDPKSGLWVEQSGPVKLDGDQALAYVRSRTYTEHIDGQQVVDPTGDLGRVERQQKFISAILSKVSGSRNPLALGRSFGNVTGGLRIDDKMSMFDALRLGWRMRGLSLDTDSLLVVPVTPTTIGSAAVLVLNEAEAPGVLEQFK